MRLKVIKELRVVTSLVRPDLVLYPGVFVTTQEINGEVFVVKNSIVVCNFNSETRREHFIVVD